tara:strand:+ start:1460 stop:1606 length:147 start_codon:yes stop_codon:yes gene_type:complete
MQTGQSVVPLLKLNTPARKTRAADLCCLMMVIAFVIERVKPNKRVDKT